MSYMHGIRCVLQLPWISVYYNKEVLTSEN